MDNATLLGPIRKQLPGIFFTLGLVAALTAILFIVVWESGLAHGSIVYLIPVVIAATRWGIVPALVAAVCGLLASAYFFYPPAYSFRVKEPQEVIDLVLFVFVAVAVSQLANRLKRQLEMARQREIDLRDLYAFSRRLAVAFDVSDIHAAIEDHLASIMTQCRLARASPTRHLAGCWRNAASSGPASVFTGSTRSNRRLRSTGSGLSVASGRRSRPGGVRSAFPNADGHGHEGIGNSDSGLASQVIVATSGKTERIVVC